MDSDEDLDEGNFKMNMGGLMAGMNNFRIGGGNEEFKMMEDDEDQVDLMDEKKKSKNLEEFYANEELSDLKNQIKMSIPGMNNKPGMPQLGHHQTNNNTEVGETESSEEQAFRMQQMKGMFNNNLINFPGLNLQTKNKFKE